MGKLVSVSGGVPTDSGAELQRGCCRRVFVTHLVSFLEQ